MHTSTPKVLCFAVLSLLAASSLVAKPVPSDPAPWTFVSIPDFLNFDIEYPQKGWEDALGFIVNSMKKEDPVFMVLSESAATAAAQAIDDGVSVQDVDYDTLRGQLLKDGQKL